MYRTCLNGFVSCWHWGGGRFHTVQCTVQCVDLQNVQHNQMLQECVCCIVYLNVHLFFFYITTLYVQFENTFNTQILIHICMSYFCEATHRCFVSVVTLLLMMAHIGPKHVENCDYIQWYCKHTALMYSAVLLSNWHIKMVEDIKNSVTVFLKVLVHLITSLGLALCCPQTTTTTTTTIK